MVYCTLWRTLFLSYEYLFLIISFYMENKGFNRNSKSELTTIFHKYRSVNDSIIMQVFKFDKASLFLDIEKKKKKKSPLRHVNWSIGIICFLFYAQVIK
jgi:hypothetical protein